MATPFTYAVMNPVFQPAMRIITAITKAYPAAVTTSFAHNYLTGLIVRLYVPAGYGMLQANFLFGAITVNGPTTFTIDIDTRTFDTYTTPIGSPWYLSKYASVVPVGEINSSVYQATHNAQSGIVFVS